MGRGWTGVGHSGGGWSILPGGGAVPWLSYGLGVKMQFTGERLSLGRIWERAHRWELPGNYPVFTVVMVIYHYVEIIWINSHYPHFLV